jgi:CubicO group peptidase (beta-lactamase class C family)
MGNFMNKLAGIFCLALAGCVTPNAETTQAQQTTPSALSLKQTIDVQMPIWLEEYNVPAAAVAFIQNGEIAWTATYGEQEAGVSTTPETLFNIASMTKPFAAETALRLASTNKIDLDEPMSAYWIDPDIIDDPRHALLTPRIALQHRTGFPNWRYQTDDILTFNSEPGTKTGYSGEGYTYLARFLEKKMQMPFDELVGAIVFTPNKMAQTSFTEKDWFKGRLAHPHNKAGEMREPSVRQEWNAADDVYTTPNDYAAFIVSVMNNEGVSDELAAIRHQVADNQFANGCPFPPEACPTSVGFGLGWSIFEYETDTVIMHGGSDWGEKTLGFFVPERALGVVIFTNSANGSKVIREVTKTLYPDNKAFHTFLNFQAQ